MTEVFVEQPRLHRVCYRWENTEKNGGGEEVEDEENMGLP